MVTLGFNLVPATVGEVLEHHGDDKEILVHLVHGPNQLAPLCVRHFAQFLVEGFSLRRVMVIKVHPRAAQAPGRTRVRSDNLEGPLKSPCLLASLRHQEDLVFTGVALGLPAKLDPRGDSRCHIKRLLVQPASRLFLVQINGNCELLRRVGVVPHRGPDIECDLVGDRRRRN